MAQPQILLNHFASDKQVPVAMDASQVFPQYQPQLPPQQLPPQQLPPQQLPPQQLPPQQLPPQQLPPQQLNTSQQRQIPSGQQQNQAPVQQKSNQIVQHFQSSFSNYDPQLILFSLEKPKTARGWEDVEPEQQHVALQDLQNELNKFRKNRGSVKRVLGEITSTSCRRRINDLVEAQNTELWKYNRSLQYRIASVEIEWRSISRRERMLKRAQVILETEPSGFQETALIKPSGVNVGNPYPVAQDPNRTLKQQNVPQNQQFQGQAVVNPQYTRQQPRPVPQSQPHHVGQIQHLEQQPLRVLPPPQLTQVPHLEQQPLRVPPPISTQNHNNAIPPPPPPGGGQPLGQFGTAVPPPPPPATQFPPLQNFKPRGVMPGAFPEPIAVPVKGMKQSFGNMSPVFFKDKKFKHKGRHGSTSNSEWASESESDNSGSDDIYGSPVNQIEYDPAGVRERRSSRHFSKSRKSQRHRSQSKPGSRSHSRSRHVKTVDLHRDNSSRRRGNSESFDQLPSRKYTPVSSQHSSPRSSRPEIPPIHIHMNTNNKTEDVRERHNSITSSPFYKAKRITEKMDMAEPMSRDRSWDRGSGTNSFGVSSDDYMAEDLVFDTPARRFSLSRGRDRTKSYSFHPGVRTNHLYDEIDDRRPSMIKRSPTEINYSPPRPNLPHRRNSVQVPTGNPFASTTHFPSQPLRAISYTADEHDRSNSHSHSHSHSPLPSYPFPSRRTMTDYTADHEKRVDLQDLADAIKHIKESRRVPPRRSGTGGTKAMGSSPVFTGDEWDIRYMQQPHMMRSSMYDESLY